MKHLYILIFLCLVLNASVYAIDTKKSDYCSDEIVDISNQLEGRVIIILFSNRVVWIYKRDKGDILKAQNSTIKSTDNKVAPWWKHQDIFIDFNISQSSTRSANAEYFVFYPYSLIDGQYLTFLDKTDNGKEDYEFLGNTWIGGFLDSSNNIAYDFTGRPIANNIVSTATADTIRLSKLNLMVPKHKYNDDKTITLLCK